MKEQTKKDIRNILIICFLIFCHFLMYMGIKQIAPEPMILNNEFDDQIPFLKEFIIPYYIWWPMLFLVPFYISRKSDKDFLIYGIAYLSC